jgi:hypothetical protein
VNLGEVALDAAAVLATTDTVLMVLSTAVESSTAAVDVPDDLSRVYVHADAR